MRILILSQWCHPEPDLKALTFGRELVKRGHSVQVLTGFPNYPGGKVYDGYKVKWSQREQIDGVDIIRVPLYPSHDNSGIKRAFNYLSFAFSAGILGLFRTRKADVMYVYHPPATVAIAAAIIKFFRRMPVVYDIQDMWPDTLKATGMLNNERVLGMVGSYMKWCYSMVDHITVLSEGFKKLLVERNIKPEKVSVVYNWSNPINLPATIDESEKENIFGKGKFTVLFAGTIGILQGMDTILEAAAILKGKGEKEVQFGLLGGGVDVERLKNEVADRQLDNVVFLNRVSNNEVGKYLKMADVLLIHLKNDPLFEITVPSKTQAYLWAGRPILVGVKGDAVRLVEEAGAGYYFEPENAQDLADKVMKLKMLDKPTLQAMGENGTWFYEQKLAIENGVAHFEQIFQKLTGKQ